MNELRTMHLFAGIGGGLLADLILGHRPIVAVEWDKYACRILRERAADGWFHDLSVWEGDVRLFDPSEYAGKVDIIAAGFPCQDISVAGKQAGLGEGTRSGLYREVLRIAGIVKPRYLFLENVSAIISLGGSGIGAVIADLSAMGYDCKWITLRASDVGAPHHRDRWWCLATLGYAKSEPSNGIENNPRNSVERQEVRQFGNASRQENVGNPEHDGQLAAKVGRSVSAGSNDYAPMAQQAGEPARPSEQHADVADTKRDRLQGQRPDGDVEGQPGLCGRARGDQEQNVLADTTSQSAVGHPGGKKQEYSMFGIGSADERPDWWATESEVGRLAHAVPNRVAMLKGLGNAQVPLQAAAAWRILTQNVKLMGIIEGGGGDEKLQRM